MFLRACLLVAIAVSGFAVACSPGSAANLINVRTAEELEELRGVEEIPISLHLRGPEITTLEPLSALRRVGGNLTLVDTRVRDLSGLDSLEEFEGLNLEENTALESASLSTLAFSAGSSGAVAATSNPALAEINMIGAEALDIYAVGNPSLGAISMEDLRVSFSVILRENDVLSVFSATEELWIQTTRLSENPSLPLETVDWICAHSNDCRVE